MDVLKVTMINDCAYVGQTIMKFLPRQLEKQFIFRSRSLWSKTFGVAYSILRANADVYHAHYLLQDCYIASRFGKRPLVGHAHGSDLRVGLKHPLWSRIVRHNLKNCDRIFVSTPDVLSIAREIREDAEYLPNPVDTTLFYPKPPLPPCDRTRVLIASDSNWEVKGTDTAIRALSQIRNEVDVSIINYGVDIPETLALAKTLDLKLNTLPKAPHEKMNEYYWNTDVVIDRFTLGSLGVVSLEAIACGRPTLAYVSSEYPENKDFPLKDLKSEKEIAQIILNLRPRLYSEEQAFVKDHHDTEKVVSRVFAVYRELIGSENT